MEKPQESVNDNSTENLEKPDALKIWTTPELKILPVPTRTQGGAFTVNDQDDMFYFS